MRPIVTDRVAWSVCLSVGLYVTIVSPAKTAEPIEMTFGCRLGWAQGTMSRSYHGKGQFWGKGRRIVKYKKYRPCAAAMRPFVKLL